MRPYTKGSNYVPARIPFSSLGAGAPAAHRVNRLMLLGPPPDMVHSARLRRTHPSTCRKRLYHRNFALKNGINPCYSGFQVQGPATSPVSMASNYIITDFHPFCNSFLKFTFFDFLTAQDSPKSLDISLSQKVEDCLTSARHRARS